ncbi:hypothetical protein JVU11DRAFT_6156 [Chiua virens]|nr:hypothetical protein JVU11DRAFT_6156 [Chiua virens]
MFQFIRRVTVSLLPRPDRPWREDATSHAPTIGRKRTHSAANHDDESASTAKRMKTDLVRPETESDSASEGENPKADGNIEQKDVKEVTKGVKEVDLEDKDEAEDVSSTRPDCVPLPDSPSGSLEPESNSPEPVEEAEDQDCVDDDKDSLASSAPEDNVEESHEDSGRSEAVPVTTNIDSSSTDETVPVSEVAVTALSGESDLHDPLEVKA